MHKMMCKEEYISYYLAIQFIIFFGIFIIGDMLDMFKIHVQLCSTKPTTFVLKSLNEVIYVYLIHS